MTYTADDFKHARFASHPTTGSMACRAFPCSDKPWITAQDELDTIPTRISDERLAFFRWVPVQESRPLTPDDITDEMIERGMTFWRMAFPYETTRESMTSLLEAALTEPPARPEGAEDIEAVLAEEYDGDGEILSAIEWRHAADFLAERFTITPKEQA